MNSFYWWKNEIQDDREAVLIAKTVKKHVPQLTEKVKSLHSYECPCIAALPVIDGNIEFFNWIKEETDLKKKSKE
jgi:periplasmic divalent cation tolerance protein